MTVLPSLSEAFWPPWLHARIDGCSLALMVKTQAKCNQLVPYSDTQLGLHIQKAPIHDAANREIILFLSKQLQVPKKEVHILVGLHHKEKVVLIAGLSAPVVFQRLIAHWPALMQTSFKKEKS